MKERGIIFNTEMVRAILDGRKTQTRRPIKVQPDRRFQDELSDDLETMTFMFGHLYEEGSQNPVNENKEWLCYDYEYPEHGAFQVGNAPYGQVGDRLYVRETFQPKSSGDGYFYYADFLHPAYAKPWSPSIHMPKKAVRIWLEITDVRVERLQEITEEDAIAEGIERGDWSEFNIIGVHRAKFFELWDSIYGDSAQNPWVWVYEFKVVS